MAARRARKTTAAAETAPEPKSRAAQRARETEEDYTKYRDKPMTDLQQRMLDWVVEKVDPELDFDDEAIDEAFAEGLRLGVALRMKFQASPENQAILAEQKAKREAAADEPDEDDEDEASKPKRKRPAAKTRRAKAAPVEDEPETDDDEPAADEVDEVDEPDEAPPAKPTRRRKPAAKPAAKPPAKPTRRRRAATAEDAPAPF